MATVGQVVYNLRDFHSSGGLISTSAKDYSQTVTSESSTYETARLNIFTNELVSLFGATAFTKLGIQAPPGTKVVLNGNKTIMIGRTGVYELDEDIKITALQFLRPYKYVINAGLTDKALQDGMAQLEAAKTFLHTSIANLDATHPVKNQDYWNKYVEIQDEYIEKYTVALNLYTQGVNGIYQLPNPGNVNDEANYAEVYDVIIDFLY